MDRLTYELGYKGSGSYEPIQNKDMPINNYITCVNKLGKIEDLLNSYNVKDLDELGKLLEMATTYEELSKQIGCQLEILFKLAKQRFFYYEENKELYLINCFDIELFNNKIYFDSNWIDHDIELGDFGTIELPLNQYGKTFWLKEDKSE